MVKFKDGFEKITALNGLAAAVNNLSTLTY